MIDLTSRSISGIEAGNQDMSISNAYKMTMALDTTLGYIVHGEYDFNSEKILDMFRGCSDEKIRKIETVVKACLEI